MSSTQGDLERKTTPFEVESKSKTNPKNTILGLV